MPIRSPNTNTVEYHLKIIFILKDAATWAHAGFEVAWEQFSVPFTAANPPIGEKPIFADLSVEQTADSIRISGSHFNLEFDPCSGAWTRYSLAGTEIFTEPLLPNFWRAPVDNDGDALLVNVRIPKFITRLLLPWLRWKTAADKRKLRKIDIKQPDSDRVQIHTTFEIPGGKTPLLLNYIINGNGEIEVYYNFTPKKKLLRAGLQTQIPGDFRKITWFGRGPQESMLDRKSGYAVGIYELDIEDFIHNYVRPQENANRSDVRWARFTDENGRSLEIHSTSDHLLNFSAWPYTMADLENADHIHKLPRRQTITLNIDYDQKGVGDLTSAFIGMPDDVQLMPDKLCEFRFTIKAI